MQAISTAKQGMRGLANRTGHVIQGHDDYLDYRNETVGEEMLSNQRIADVLKRFKSGDATAEEVRQVASDESSVVKMVSIAATLGIGIFVISQIFDATPTPTNSDMANASADVQQNTAAGFNLGSIIPLVIAAVVVLAYIIGIGVGR